MDNIKMCPRCDRIFERSAPGLCDECRFGEKLISNEFRSFLQEHSQWSYEEALSKFEATEAYKEILKNSKPFMGLREVDPPYPCQLCLGPIRENHLCSKCLANLQKSIKSIQTRVNEFIPPRDGQSGFTKKGGDAKGALKDFSPSKKRN